MDIKELIATEDVEAKELEELVKKSISEEEMLTCKLVNLEENTKLTFGQKLADKVADFGGSWTFIIAFGVFIFVWVLLNVYWIMHQAFDPYPFIFLNLILSCLAALQAPIIMMSQNRQEDKDRIRARSDYMINLKSEMEIRNLHEKIDLLISEEMKTLFNVQQSQMELLLKIQSKLENK